MGRMQTFESRTRGLSQGTKQRWKGCGRTGGSRWRSWEAGTSWHFLPCLSHSCGIFCCSCLRQKEQEFPVLCSCPSRSCSQDYRSCSQDYRRCSRPTAMPCCPGWSLYVLIKPQPGGCGALRPCTPQPSPHMGSRENPALNEDTGSS